MYTGSSDGTAKCWVTEFGDNTVTYKGHAMSVTVLRFYKGLCKYVNKPMSSTFNLGLIKNEIKLIFQQKMTKQK